MEREKKRRWVFSKTKDDQYNMTIDNLLVYTDGNWRNPEISKVIDIEGIDNSIKTTYITFIQEDVIHYAKNGQEIFREIKKFESDIMEIACGGKAHIRTYSTFDIRTSTRQKRGEAVRVYIKDGEVLGTNEGRKEDSGVSGEKRSDGGSQTGEKNSLRYSERIAKSAGLYHPNCRDGHTTYFEGISSPPSRKWTKKELEEIERNAKKEARKNHARRQAERFGRLAKFSLDEENRRRYKARAEEWEETFEDGAHGIKGDFVKYDDGADFVVDVPYYLDKLNRALSESARKVAKFGSEHKYEYGAIIDIDTGLEVDFGTSEEYSSVSFYYKFLREHIDGKYAMIHNHNAHTPLS